MPVEACTVVGPRLILSGPLPVPPPHSLLNTEGVVVGGDDRGKWMNGATIDVLPGDTPHLWDPLDVGTYRTKDEGDALTFPDFDPFVAYLPVTCSAFNWEATERKSREVIAGTFSFPVEKVLSSGVSGSPTFASPFFGDANVNVLATGVTAGVGLSWLENAIGESGRRGMIHATPAVIAALDRGYDVDDGFEGQLRTPNGTPVVSGGGYTNAHVHGHGGLNAGSDWMFATGPVQVRMSDVFITGIRETLDRSDNTVTFRAERTVLATWDTTLQAAVLVDWTS